MEEYLENIKSSFLYVFDSNKRIAAGALAAGGFFFLMLASISPSFVLSVFEYNGSLLEAIHILFFQAYLEWGFIGVVTDLIYSSLVGIAVIVGFNDLQLNGWPGWSGIFGSSVGMVAAGCAGCGTGLLAFAGLSGAAFLLPFNGLLVKSAGAGLILYFLADAGDPRTCNLD